MIHKSATRACEITWNNGNVTTLWLGHNRSTGEAIVWQVVRWNGKLGKSTRLTGRNITKLVAEMARYVNADGRYTYRSDAAMAQIGALL